MDFTGDTLSHGGKFRTLIIIDDRTHDCLVIEVSRNLSTADIIAVLERFEWCCVLPNEIYVITAKKLLAKR
ncbi:MAG: hypothetical protein C0473_00540 [Cyanobacteria bacterium DS3.002]|nr:hypothetical protein [Cyanobacteria bacterium DS3.002]MBA4049446.1 hypothetical protein [Cyanobacteria bacterium DS2.008]MBA4075022.1 hypothetical protein [Cyanobacteria bacterium PR.023]